MKKINRCLICKQPLSKIENKCLKKICCICNRHFLKSEAFRKKYNNIFNQVKKNL